MKKTIYIMLFAATFAIACSNDSNRNNRSGETEETSEALNDTDKDFMKHAGHGNAAEASAGKLAGEKAMNADVKAFGAMMSTDHTGALSELQTLGQTLNVEVPSMPDEKHIEKEQELNEKNGIDFDKEYIKGQVDDHEKTVNLFEDEIKDGKHVQVIAYANKYLPTIKAHLEKAKQLEEMVKKAK